MDIPRDLIEQNKMVTLMADVMFINEIPFLIMYGRGIGLIMLNGYQTGQRNN